jgi:hypothetical protein
MRIKFIIPFPFDEDGIATAWRWCRRDSPN